MGTPPTDETYTDPVAIPREASVPRHPHLILALECERPLAGSARYTLANADEVVIGRGTERRAVRSVDGRKRRVSLGVPDRRMSTTHGRLLWTGQEWSFEDLGSRNGSLLNCVRAREGVVGDGDVLQLGHTLFFVREELPTPDGTPDDVDTADLAHESAGLRTLVPALTVNFRSLAKVAASRVSVLLLGETGTGKELLARAIHERSRPSKPFVAVNCGAIPATLVESQLFGHVKGAFSGAVRDEAGFVRASDGGTLFLDEVGELPRHAQAVLLRVLQEGEVVPVGSTRPVAVDLRVVAATHRPLDALAASGEFRGDLLARLGGLTFRLPGLRDRREDIGLLMAELLPRCAPIVALDPAAAHAFLAYDWPHNVRELEKVLALVTVLAGGASIRAADLPPALQEASRKLVSNGAAARAAETEAPLRASLIAELEKHRGNVTEVARTMGKARQQVHRWLRRLRIDPKLYR
jgi:DNA-binding NtrC family response regulator